MKRAFAILLTAFLFFSLNSYSNHENEEHIYFNVTGEGEINYNFKTNTIVNNNEKKIEGRFSGTLSTNGKETSTDLKGTFKIQY